MNKKMNNLDTKIDGMARHGEIALIIAILCFCIGVVTAIPQQDYTLYGTATLNGKVLTAQDDAIVSLKVEGIELVSYTMGDISSTNNYVLKVPMDSDSSVTTAAQEGDTALIYINGIAINEGPQIIGTPGTTVQFAISATSASNQPSVTVRYPNGGESIPIGTQVEVSAHATDDAAVTGVTFYYSSNGGSNWNSIGTGTRVSGTDKDGIWNKNWDTSGLSAGTNYVIKAVASDGTLTGEDQSDSTFSLTCTPPSSPTLNDPGTTDTDGDYTVSWSSVSGATSYTLEEDTSTSFSSPTVVHSGADTSKYITGKSTGTYYYRVKVCNACGCSGWSNVEYIVVSHEGAAPSVTVVYPNGGESISIGTQVQVSAHATDDAAVTGVTFYYSRDGGSNWSLIGESVKVSGTDKDGAWNNAWNTDGLSAGTNYLIKAVVSDGASTGEDQSDSAFSLTGIQSQPSVKEMWRYKTNGIVWDVEIADIDNDNDSEVIVASDKLYVLNKLGSKERSFGQNIKSVEIGDINGDRIKDIIAGQSGGIITAYTDNGLEFWRLSLTTDFPKVIAVFDLNNDGLDEVLIASRECKFYMISGDGNILWIYSIGAWSDSDSMDGAIIDDIDNDNVFDIAIGGRDSKITALSGVNGCVIWEYAIPDSVGSVINAGDLNGDAYDDVVVGSWDTNVYAINGNNGSLLWKFVTPLHGHMPASVAILGDINSDGTLDVAVGLDDVYALDGKTGHQIWVSTESFHGIETIVTTDLNADGILDVCIGTTGVDPYANVYAVNGHNGNTLWSFLEPESTIYGLTAGDIDNDGKNDIIAGSQDTLYALTTQIISGTVGAISVSSSPSGAAIHLEGFAGPSIKTPYTITNVPVGTSTITLTLDGYLDWSTNVHVIAGTTSSVHATLAPMAVPPSTTPQPSTGKTHTGEDLSSIPAQSGMISVTEQKVEEIGGTPSGGVTGIKLWVLYNGAWTKDPAAIYYGEWTYMLLYLDQGQSILMEATYPSGWVDTKDWGYLSPGYHYYRWIADAVGWHKIVADGSITGHSNEIFIYVWPYSKQIPKEVKDE